MTTTTEERRYVLDRDDQGLTQRERQVRDLLAAGQLTQTAIGVKLGVNKQRVSEIKKKLEAEGKLDAVRPLELLTKSEFRATSAALRRYVADEGAGTSAGAAAARALAKVKGGLVPHGASW